MFNYLLKYRLLFIFCLCVMMLSSCYTGIERTKTIKMSKTERKEILPSDEETLAEKFISKPLGEWMQGKRFLIADNKALHLLEPSDHSITETAGLILYFEGVSSRRTAGTQDVAIINFKEPVNGVSFNYNTRKPVEAAKSELTGLDIPALIDLDLVDLVGSTMNGNTYWTRNSLWYDEEGNNLKGYKFVPVTITGVFPGDMLFPINLEFTTSSGKTAHIMMNIKSADGLGAESRTFPSLFTLTDPKLKYPGITDENWRLIQAGKVTIGMTKEECKLALGNPNDVDAGHDWNNTIDIWRYSDGTFLHFQDGLLVNFRH